MKKKWIFKANILHNNTYDYSKVVYTHSEDDVIIICKKHGEFKTNLKNHARVSGCPSCSSKNVFSTLKPATLYYIRIERDGNTAYKIGVTNSSLKNRFTASQMKYITILQETKYDDGYQCKLAEREICSKFKTDRYQGPKLLPYGHTEMFNRDVLGLDLPVHNCKP